MSNLFFTQTKLSMLSKSGDAKPDADGYYELVVGALNVFNNSGSWFYTAEGVKQLFGPGSLLHRKIANGCLRAEVGHPTPLTGEDQDKFMQRMMDINLKNVCAHFKDVWIDENFGKNHPEYHNPSMIAIMAKVKPIPPFGDILKAALENKHENVCFSIRSLAEQKLVQGKLVRTIQDVITFDYINEGGITVASKWDSPATETADNRFDAKIIAPVTEQAMRRIVAQAKERAFALESVQDVQYVLNKHFASKGPSIYQKW